MLYSEGSQPTGMPLGLKQESGILMPPDDAEFVFPLLEDEVVFPVEGDSLGIGETLDAMVEGFVLTELSPPTFAKSEPEGPEPTLVMDAVGVYD